LQDHRGFDQHRLFVALQDNQPSDSDFCHLPERDIFFNV
jgi:hypothetical protein